MPTVLRIGPYHFFFYAGDRVEPRHIHVKRDDWEVKFWLAPIRLVWNIGFAAHEVRRIERMIRAHEREIEAGWDEYHTEAR